MSVRPVVATIIPGTSMSFQEQIIGDSMSTQLSSQSSLTALSIRELPPSERPRERLVALGACALSSVELLALLVGAGRARSLSDAAGGAPAPVDWSSVGRNDPCPCGSGKKFKKCHGATL